MQDDVATAWRLFLFNWVAIAVMSAVFALGVVLAGFIVELSGLVFSLGFVLVYGGFAHVNACTPARRDPQVMFVLGGTAQIVMITVVMAPLTYVAAAANFPLQDGNLLAIDRALGFDWAGYVAFVNDRPLLAMWLSYGYSMIRWPLFAIPVVLAAACRYRRLTEFTLAFGLALAATIVISALVPAIGVYQQIGLDPDTLSNLAPRAYLDQVRDLAPVREGSLRYLDLFALAGIVTFPSFHAGSALLYAWALWPVRWIRPIAILANVMMLAATPIDGGHYFVDLAAGLVVAMLAILAARWCSRRLAARSATGDIRGALAPAE